MCFCVARELHARHRVSCVCYGRYSDHSLPRLTGTVFSTVALFRESAAALRRAADYLHLPLPGPDCGSLERASVRSGVARSSGDFLNDCARSSEHCSATAPVVGLIFTPSSGIFLSNLLGIWYCGAVALVLPCPSPASCAVVADSVTAAAASTASAAAVFSKNGHILHTYTADALNRDNSGPSTYTKTCNPSSGFVSSTRENFSGVELRAYARTWEYQLADSGCQLLVATPEVAATARVVASKLGLPVCILVSSYQQPDAVVGQLARRSSAIRGTRHGGAGARASSVARLATSARVYVPDVLYDSSRASRNVTRWRLLQQPQKAGGKATMPAPIPSGRQEQRVVINQPAMHFYQFPSVHAPRAAVYGYAALATQAVRNAELLGLNCDDHVAVMTLGWERGQKLSLADLYDSRMLCSPKGLVAVALPAVVAGAALSFLSGSSGVCYAKPLPLPMHIHRLRDRLGPRSSQPESTGVQHHRFSANFYGQGSAQLGRESHPVSGQSDAVHASLGSSRQSQGAKATAVETDAEALGLWETLSRMRQQLRSGERAESWLEPEVFSTTAEAEALQEPRGVSVLALDLRTATLMVEALRHRRRHRVGELDTFSKVSEPSSRTAPRSPSRAGMVRGAVEQSALPRTEMAEENTQEGGSIGIRPPTDTEVSCGDLARYIAAAKALRLVCICTDEGDLRSHCEGRRATEGIKKGLTIAQVLRL